jgi:hypothetical protein
MKAIVPFLFIIVSICFSSCCRQIQCTNTGAYGIYSIGMIGFDSTELDSVIVTKFVIGSGFTYNHGSFELDSSNCSIKYGDTTYFNIGIDIFQLNPGYDYEIIIPATNTLVKIDNMIQPQTSIKSCIGGEYHPSSCINEVTSVNINGLPQKFPSTIFIRK